MGNDGGSIPKRRELVKNAARALTTSELKATTLESLGHAWSHCALSGDPLEKDNVVSDWCGRLFNYEAILSRLMPADEVPDVTPASFGIRSLRDVAKLKFTRDGEKLVCPISMKELGPSVKSVYLVPCGHAFAEVAIHEIQEKSCPECAEAFESDNTIPIFPAKGEETTKLEKRLENLRAKGLTHTLKRDKSEKKKKRKAEDATGESKDPENTSSKDKPKTDKRSKLSGINNPLAASLTARVMAEQEERNKRRKMTEEVRAR